MKAAIAALLLLASPAMAQVYPGSNDTPLVTGPTFQQVPAGLIMVTPYGGQQMTLSEALAQGGGGGGGVTSVVGAMGTVTLGNLVAGGVASTVTVNSAIASATSGLAPLLNPTFTGTMIVPQPATGDNSSRAATTAWVDALVAAIPPGSISTPTPTTLGGVFSLAPVTHQVLLSLGTNGHFTQGQLSCGDLSDAQSGCSSASGGGGSTGPTVSPTFIPKLPEVIPSGGGAINVTHAFSGLIVIANDTANHTWTLGTPATVGDDVCFYQPNATGVITFAGNPSTLMKAATGVPTTLATQYSRLCAFFDGTQWVMYNG